MILLSNSQWIFCNLYSINPSSKKNHLFCEFIRMIDFNDCFHRDWSLPGTFSILISNSDFPCPFFQSLAKQILSQHERILIVFCWKIELVTYYNLDYWVTELLRCEYKIFCVAENLKFVVCKTLLSNLFEDLQISWYHCDYK